MRRQWGGQAWRRESISRTAARFPSPIVRKRPPMPAEDCIRLEDAQPAPPARPETGQPNPQQPVRLPESETTWRALLQDGDLMAESQDVFLSMLSSPPTVGVA